MWIVFENQCEYFKDIKFRFYTIEKKFMINWRT